MTPPSLLRGFQTENPEEEDPLLQCWAVSKTKKPEEEDPP